MKNGTECDIIRYYVTVAPGADLFLPGKGKELFGGLRLRAMHHNPPLSIFSANGQRKEWILR